MIFYLSLLFIAFSALATATASAAHGGNYLSKGHVVAIHFFLLPTVAPLFWLFFRRGKQADAEMEFHKGKGDIVAVRQAYPLIGHLIAPVIEWVTAHPWEHVNRRTQQELCSGFVIGAVLALPTLLAVAWPFSRAALL